MHLRTLISIDGSYGKEARERIFQAYEMAREAHQGQFRESGEEFIIHPIAVAEKLMELRMDSPSVIAGVLHDVIEDTERNYEDIREWFGTEIADLVEGVTKLKKRRDVPREVQKAENFKKLIKATLRDVRVVIIKLVDRLHNMRTLEYRSVSKQKQVGQETLDIYVPIAYNLGMNGIGRELEELSLKYLYPEDYYKVTDRIHMIMEMKKSQVQEAMLRISRMAGRQIQELSWEPLCYSDLYNNRREHRQAAQWLPVYFDITATVGEKKDCYLVLGEVHRQFLPFDSEFHDTNTSNHVRLFEGVTTMLLDTYGNIFRVRIVPQEAREAWRLGVAALWDYDRIPYEQIRRKIDLKWLSNIFSWAKSVKNGEEYLASLKMELNIYASSIRCFDENGRCLNLPEGAYILDYVYERDEKLADTFAGALVNRQEVDLSYRIQDGDMIALKFDGSRHGPEKIWLNYVATNSARYSILEALYGQQYGGPSGRE